MYSAQCDECFRAAVKSLHQATADRKAAEMGVVVAPATRLPAMFWDDHDDRDLPAGMLLRRNARSVWVDLDQAAIDDLRSDAEHYVDPYGEYEPQLRSAARSMLNALDRAGL